MVSRKITSRPQVAARRFQSTPISVPKSGPGTLGQFLYGLGFVPKSEAGTLSSEVSALQAQLSQLNTQNNGLTSKASGIESQFSSLNSQIAALAAQEPQLLSQYAAAAAKEAVLKTTVQSLESQYYALQEHIGSLNANIDSLNAELLTDASTIASLGSSLSTDATTIASLRGQIGSIQTSIASLASSITGVAANPALGTRNDPYTQAVVANGGPNVNDPDFGTLPLLGNDIDYPSFGRGDDAYAPAQLGFLSQYAGLTVTSGQNLLQARRVGFQATGGALGSRVASVLGYIPISELSSATAQLASLQSEVSAATELNQLLQTRVGNDQSALSSTNSQLTAIQGAVAAAQALITSTQAQISALTAQITGIQAEISQAQQIVASLQAQITNLTNQHNANLSIIQTLTSQHGTNVSTVIPNLQSELTALTQEWSKWKAGGFPVSFSWDFNDGTASTDPNPTHTFQNPGIYSPSLTVTVTTPDGVQHSRTFTWHQFLIGQWPGSIQVNGGGATYSGTVNATVYDVAGNPIPNLKVLYIARGRNVWTGQLGSAIAQGTDTADSNGIVRYGYNVVGQVRFVVVRDPLKNATSGLATVGG